jgi:hypothetical protein
MPPSEDPSSGSDRLKRALETHSIQTVRFLLLAKEELGDSDYSALVKAVREIAKQRHAPPSCLGIISL